MNSRITIEVDFENNNTPVIQVVSQDSDDTRDKLIAHFLEGRQSLSRWLTIQYKGEKLPHPVTGEGRGSIFHLTVVPPKDFRQEIKLMEAALGAGYNAGDPVEFVKGDKTIIGTYIGTKSVLGLELPWLTTDAREVLLLAEKDVAGAILHEVTLDKIVQPPRKTE